MSKDISILLPFFLLCFNALSQKVSVNSGIDTTNIEINRVITTWNSYINQEGLIGKDENKYWIEYEQKILDYYDLNSARFGDNWYKKFQYQIKEVRALGNGNYIIKLHYYRDKNDSPNINDNEIADISFLVVKENNKYYLSNIFNHYLNNYRKYESHPEITHYFNNTTFSLECADKINALCDTLYTKLPITQKKMFFIHSSNYSADSKIMGLVPLYFSSVGLTPSERFPDKNVLFLFGNPELDYKQEVVYFFSAKAYPKVKHIFHQGLTNFVSNMYMYESLTVHYKKLYDYFKSHPELDLINTITTGDYIYFSGGSNLEYVVSAILFDLIFVQGGWDSFNEIMRILSSKSYIMPVEKQFEIVFEYLKLDKKNFKEVILKELEYRINLE